jgi:hypothetical protein
MDLKKIVLIIFSAVLQLLAIIIVPYTFCFILGYHLFAQFFLNKLNQK